MLCVIVTAIAIVLLGFDSGSAFSIEDALYNWCHRWLKPYLFSGLLVFVQSDECSLPSNPQLLLEKALVASVFAIESCCW